jgi:hypothetical protein
VARNSGNWQVGITGYPATPNPVPDNGAQSKHSIIINHNLKIARKTRYVVQGIFDGPMFSSFFGPWANVWKVRNPRDKIS